MSRKISSLWDIETIRMFLLPAVILGAGCGIFVHGYWLIDIFPVDSIRLLISSVLVGLVGTAGYFLLFRWMKKELSGLSKPQLAGLIGSSIVVGTFLFFTVTDRWQSPARYVSFFLPSQTLQVTIPPGQAPDTVSIFWVNTSLGDVSYDALDYSGWEREGERLVLTDVSGNSLHWVGRTGGRVQIIFEVSSPGGEAVLSWNGQDDVLRFSGKKNTYTRSFDVPYFASRGWILLLGVINFALLSIPLCLLAWKKRTEILQPFHRTPEATSYRVPETLVLLAVIALALLLRVPNLENLFPGVDEYYQLNAAKQITQGVSIWDVYQRSLWIVTLPVSVMFKIFGYKLWAARLPGAVINALAIIPLYLITRKINHPVAILSILLYATSPWIITFGRIVREYAYYPFVYYWVIYGMVLFLERFPDRFRIEKDWRVLLKPKLLLLSLGLVLPPIYGLYLDITSTFKLILIAYVILGVFIFFKMDLMNRWKMFFIVFISGFILVSAYFWPGKLLISPGFNLSPMNYFFLNPPQQWYFDRIASIPLAGLLGAVVLTILLRRVNFIPLFLLSLFGGFLSFFVFSSNKFFGTRHLSTTQLWYIVLLAMGLHLVWNFLQTFPAFRNNRFIFPTIAILGLLVFNVQQSALPVTNDDPDMPISMDYHHDMGSVQEFMLANVQDGDILISSVYGLYAEWMGTPAFHDVYRFDIHMTNERMTSLINQNASGWIVIDTIRVDAAAFSLREAFSKDVRIEYLGQYGDEHVWHWKK